MFFEYCGLGVCCMYLVVGFFVSSRRRHTIFALVTGVQTCALPIWASVQKSLLMGSDYGVSTMVRGQPRVHKLWRLKHLVVKAWDNPIVDKITVGSRLAQSPNDLATRLSAGECEACGDTDGPFEMHHPNRQIGSASCRERWCQYV